MDQIQSLMDLRTAAEGLILKQVQVVSPESPYHGKMVDMQIADGKIIRIAGQLEADGEVIDGKGCMVSPGWMDLKATLNEPGMEGRDTWQQLQASALAGGFTDVCVYPNEQHPFDQPDAVRQAATRTQAWPVAFHPIANATKGGKGEEMAELMNLTESGAIAFADLPAVRDEKTIVSLMRYLGQMDGLLIHQPDVAIWQSPQMHEGQVSVRLGMPGMPSLSERLAIQRDLGLAAYTGGRIHFSCISTAEAVELIRTAKQQGIRVTCDVAAYQMSFTDEDLSSFDTHLKVMPPFRTLADHQALWRGIADGTIDAICSNHHPLDLESKRLEFDLADFGTLSLETAWPALLTAKPDALPSEQLMALLANGARTVLNLPKMVIKEDSPARLTLASTDGIQEVSRQMLKSKSANSPFLGKKLRGKVVGCVVGNFVNENTY